MPSGLFDSCKLDEPIHYFREAWPWGYKNVMFSSAEHENLNADKYDNIKKFKCFRLR